LNQKIWNYYSSALEYRLISVFFSLSLSYAPKENTFEFQIKRTGKRYAEHKPPKM